MERSAEPTEGKINQDEENREEEKRIMQERQTLKTEVCKISLDGQKSTN